MSPSNSISVAAIDTGVDPERIHAAHLLPGLNLSDEGQSDETIDYGTHGTEVAQTILSIAPQARIVPIKIVNRKGILRNPETMSIAFQWILENRNRLNIRVICVAIADASHSQSDESYADHSLPPLITTLREAGVATVAAAGNWYPEHRRFAPQGMAFPAILRQVISVGAIEKTLEGVQLTRNSQRLHPSLGTECHTTFFVEPGAPGETSGAAAIVAGHFANLAQTRCEATANEWIDLLESACQSVPDVDGLNWSMLLH